MIRPTQSSPQASLLTRAQTIQDPDARETSTQPHPGRILLVSDDRPLSSLLRSVLGQAGFSASICSSVDRAESIFINNRDIDLWIIDVQSLGVEAVSLAVRVLDMQPRIPMLFFAQEHARETALLDEVCRGCKRLRKPVNLPNFLSTVQAVMLRPAVAECKPAQRSRPPGGPHSNSDYFHAAVVYCQFRRNQN